MKTKIIRAAKPKATAPVAKQRRSQITYDKLIEAGYKLLATRDFDSISIAEIAGEAGYSVGAFYSRFENKEEFFLALFHLESAKRRDDTGQFFLKSDKKKLPRLYVERTISRAWNGRFFWRAALRRSLDDPNFWEPYRQLAHFYAEWFIEAKSQHIGRALTKSEKMNMRFAVQLVHGTINNAMINRPGPFMLEDRDFKDRLTEAFRLVSRYDELK